MKKPTGANNWQPIRRGRSLRQNPRVPSSNGTHVAVVDEIGSRIVQGLLAPGDQLPTGDDWSAMLGVSRTALRESIKVLSGKGLIESRQKTGTRVRPRELWNFLDADILAWRFSAGKLSEYARELFELRRMVEPPAAALAAARAKPGDLAKLEECLRVMEDAGDDGDLFAKPDLVFHQTILRMTGNELIGSLAAGIEAALTVSFQLSNPNPAGQRHSLPLHRDVVDAIRNREEEKAREAMTVLINGAEEDVRKILSLRPRRWK